MSDPSQDPQDVPGGTHVVNLRGEASWPELGRESLRAVLNPTTTQAPGTEDRDYCILIIDDEPMNVKLLETVLKNVDSLQTVSTSRSTEAVDLYKATSPDLVMLDLHMPQMDGFEVMSAIRRLIPSGDFVPFVVLTADVTPAYRSAALSAGADDFLLKPLDQTEVVLRVRNLLRTRSLHLRAQHERAEFEERLREKEAAERAEEKRLVEAAIRIRDVLDRGALDVVFQPIVDLTSGEVVGMEALSRFSVEPLRSPDKWFAEAAEVGLGMELELMAIDRALELIRRMPNGAFLSVNASPQLIASGVLMKTGVVRYGSQVVVEVTEHARIDDYAPLNQSLAQLRSRGIRFAVDDAGAGFASLQHILKLQPDLIKLDITITRGIDADPIRRALTASLVMFGDEVGARLVAEGIETEAEQTTLCSLGVHLGQGYRLGRPASLPEIDGL